MPSLSFRFTLLLCLVLSIISLYSILAPTTPDVPVPVLDTSNPSGKDFKDPFFESRQIYYGTIMTFTVLIVGPWKAKIPNVVVAGEQFTMQFTCTSPEPTLCPAHYMVMFTGPTKLNVSPELFGQLEWTLNFPSDHAVVEARFEINDPGRYKILAYPDFMYCRQWDDLEFPWHRATVQDCPLEITVVPNRKDDTIEAFGKCTTEQIENGRFLSTNPALSSEAFSALYKDSGRSYIYAPYECKVPHRTLIEALTELPSANHIVYVGDSTMRGPFCAKLWEGLHGTVEHTLCDYLNSPGEYYENKWGHKSSYAVLSQEHGFAEPRNVSISFFWSPSWLHFDKHNIPAVLEMDPPPTHLVVNMGLYVSPVILSKS
jgi:hypothetical protein